jgi:hypothetical protein
LQRALNISVTTVLPPVEGRGRRSRTFVARFQVEPPSAESSNQ